MTLPHMHPAKRAHYVYRAFDAQGDLLYVGCTVSPKRRWQEHRSSGTWAFEAKRFKLTGPFTYEAAREMERRAINTERPAFNRTSPERKAAESAHRALYDGIFYSALRGGASMDEAFAAAKAGTTPLPTDNRKLVSA